MLTLAWFPVFFIMAKRLAGGPFGDRIGDSFQMRITPRYRAGGLAFSSRLLHGFQDSAWGNE
ncbi:MAG: hypothetical protein IIC64_02050 [SAR324 cluster bacterium]|nr:hypothetical protein [SAR324 cluster bacterium]